ncbi:hypothetical protein TIFTF001_031319 [Ficus carica]|uniref:Uncharacterized protein n=1 Tax=Ficus carica TaxID=3494 RepID=A0AA88DV46_FICCA|nr:hypothetical protein TIFTF001_031319 [Ficus carica]
MGPKGEDQTIAEGLLGVEVTAGLGGMRFGEMEEGKGRGFDVLNNNDGLPIVRAYDLFVRFRFWGLVGPARLVVMQGVW